MFSLPVPKRLNPRSASLLAVSSVAFSLLARMFLSQLLGTTSVWVTFFWAIFVSAWAGGFWPGVLTTFVAAGAAQIFLTEEKFLLLAPYSHYSAGTLVFLLTGAFTSFLLESLRNAHESSLLSTEKAERSAKDARESEERFRTMADSAPLLIWTSTPKGTRDYVNAPFLQMSGRTSRDELGEGWLELVHPDDRAPVRKAYERARRDQARLLIEYRMRRHDGVYRWMLDSGAPRFSAGGEYLGSVGSCLDFTDRRHAEQSLREREAHLRLSMSASQTGTWHFDNEHQSLELSRELEIILGYEPESAPDLTNFASSLIYPEDRERAASAWSRILEQGGEHEIECRVFCGRGEVRWLLIRGQGFLDSRGKCGAIRGVAMDVTDRKAFDERSRHAQKLESLGVLAGGIAHDFNNLLTAIMGSASMVIESLEPGSFAYHLQENVLEAGHRAAQLTGQMLAFSGKGHFVIENIDIAKLVADNLRLMGASIQNKKVDLKLSRGQNSFVVEGDPGQMQQLIMNLVMNAAEAIPEDQAGVVRVTLSTRRTTEPSPELALGNYVLIQVQDSGIGMDEATAACIFDPFFTTKFLGRGLGLAAVQGIVRGHKGQISVASTPGVGTTFEVVLPCAAGSPQEAATQPVRTNPSEGTILVVDDEDLVRATAVATLERAGFATVAAEHGQRAVEIFQESPARYAAVVLDMTMPVMNGEEALRVFKKIRPDIKVIACSGYSEAVARERFPAGGLAAFIQKPYSSNQLAEKVRIVTQAV